MTRGFKRARRFTAFLLLLLILWCGWVLHQINQVESAAAPQHADVAIVLGAAVWGEEPSPGLKERLNRALELYRENYVNKLLVSGGLGEGKRVTEAEAMKNYLIAQGVLPEDILLEEQARSTYENLAYSKPLMEENGLSSALIVSHGYHLARAMDMAHTLGLEASPVAAETHVLVVPYHKAREIAAFTQWKATQLLDHIEKPQAQR